MNRIKVWTESDPSLTPAKQIVAFTKCVTVQEAQRLIDLFVEITKSAPQEQDATREIATMVRHFAENYGLKKGVIVDLLDKGVWITRPTAYSREFAKGYLNTIFSNEDYARGFRGLKEDV